MKIRVHGIAIRRRISLMRLRYETKNCLRATVVGNFQFVGLADAALYRGECELVWYPYEWRVRLTSLAKVSNFAAAKWTYVVGTSSRVASRPTNYGDEAGAVGSLRIVETRKFANFLKYLPRYRVLLLLLLLVGVILLRAIISGSFHESRFSRLFVARCR